MTFEPWQWALLALAAFIVGLSKSGIPGFGILIVGIFANVLPAKAATGFVLPLLIVGDVVAVATYRRHTRWVHVLRLLPWTAGGVVLGTFALGVMEDREVGLVIGVILLAMLALHFWRNRAAARHELETAVAGQGPWFAPLMGVLAGFTTQIANAAGPVMILYLLAMRLPKLEFLGTSAVFFCVLNLFKFPFMAGLGMITAESALVNLQLAPAVVAGSLFGRAVAMRLPQRTFEVFALALTFLAAFNLLRG